MRLIDADTLRAARYHALPYTHIHALGVDVESYECGWNDALDAAAESAPTVEAEPVKHGHWIEHDVGLICSECGHYTESMYDEPFNNKFGKGWALKRPYYCGYCGAKMDEVTE